MASSSVRRCSAAALLPVTFSNPVVRRLSRPAATTEFRANSPTPAANAPIPKAPITVPSPRNERDHPPVALAALRVSRASCLRFARCREDRCC